jgi:hypothetical protein
MSIARSYTLIIAGLAILLLSACRDAPPEPPPVLRLSLTQPDELVIGGRPDYQFGLTLAPDGRRLVFPATAGGHDFSRADHRHALYLRDLRTNDVRQVPGTLDGVLPFWAPDGGSIAFFADGKLRALELASGSVRDLADAASPAGGAWLPNGDVIFAPTADGGLVRRAADGAITPFTTLSAGEVSHRLPHAFGTAHVIFYVRATETARRGVWIAPLDRPDERQRLASSDAHAVVSGDAVVYSNGGALVAQRIDVESLALQGRPVLLATSVGYGSQHELFATAGGDVLIHGAPSSGLRQLQWLDLSGETRGVLGEPMHAWDVRIAPATSRVATTRVDPQLNTLDIWIYEAERPVPRRLSPSINVDESPAWSPDGSRLVWVSGRTTLMVRDSRATAPETTIHKFERPIRVTDWSPSDWIVLTETQADGRGDITLASVSSNADVRDYLRSPFNETFGTVSPDGRWLAYRVRSRSTRTRFPSRGRAHGLPLAAERSRGGAVTAHAFTSAVGARCTWYASRRRVERSRRYRASASSMPARRSDRSM